MDRDDLLRLLLDRRAAILGYIATVLPDRAAGEDVFQETLIRASAEAERFDHPGHALAWVRGTARNLARNENRRSARRPLCLDADVLDLLDPTWTGQDGRDDARSERLAGCLGRLSPGARTLIRLRFADDLDTVAIANRVGRTTAAIHTAFGRIFRSLEECIRNPAPADGGRPC